MGKMCDNCTYQEKGYDDVYICQHIQSMNGLEALIEYAICDDIENCKYHNPKTEVNT